MASEKIGSKIILESVGYVCRYHHMKVWCEASLDLQTSSDHELTFLGRKPHAGIAHNTPLRGQR